jgi:signal transduction histidine kinase
MAAIRRPVRSRPIRLFLISMFAVPLASLVGLWVFAASVTVPAAIKDHAYNTSSRALSSTAVETVTYELPAERAESYVWLLSGRKTANASLLATRAIVDKELPAAEIALQSEDGELSAANKAVLHTLLTDLRQLGGIEQSVDAGKLTPTAAFQTYSDIMDALYQSFYTGTQDRSGSGLAVSSIGALQTSYSLEMASREIAVADGALTVAHGIMSPAAKALFTTSAGQRLALLNEALGLLPNPYLASFTAVVNSPMYKQFTAMEQQIETTPDNKPIPVNATAWESVSEQYQQVMQATSATNGPRLAAASSSASSGLLTQAILAGGVGLLAVLVSVFLLIWFGRKVTGDLTGLYSSVRGMAEERLPRVVDRLRRGEDVDVLAESPPPDGSGIQEISQIARSFGIVQEAAVAAAVEQARLRKGVNQVFLNISMRNQSLLHRQLGMLDSMERRTSDPGALADLFRLDHLTTRMRRHAEGLIILSGSTPGRGWREPVPIVDVLRAAVAEVEDYVRIDVLSESRDLVAGNAVSDVIHLVAELVENAAAFSPPNTRIEVRADRAGTGLVAEVEDRGLGLSEEELADINRRLASPPEFDLANSEQLGLFVVSRLAVRHAIKVSLRQSVYGGTTAILVLPFGVIVREEEAGALAGPGDPPGDLLPAAGAGGSDPVVPPLSPFGATGRHRLPSAATGPRADTGPAGRSEGDRPPAPRPIARAPWEYASEYGQPEPPAPARPSAPERPATAERPPVPEPPPALESPQARAKPAERPPWYVEVDSVSPWPHAFNRDAPGRGPVQPSGSQVAPVARRDQRAAGPAASGSHLGMPIRVPQANLAPQLQSRRDSGRQPAGAAAAEIDERPPEATRNMMLMMQQGWERGRADDLDDPADGPGNGTER